MGAASRRAHAYCPYSDSLYRQAAAASGARTRPWCRQAQRGACVNNPPTEPNESALRANWRLLVACALGVGFGSIGFVTYSIGAFVDPLRTEFGWSRTEVQGAVAFGMGFGGFAAPAIGYFNDRFGGRRIALGGLIAVALGYAMVALAEKDLWYFYLCYTVIAVLGAGSGPVSWTRAVASHFHRRRGLALALTLTGTGVAAIIVPPYAVYVVEHFGWRSGYCGLALLPLIALAVASACFFPGNAKRATDCNASALHPSGMSLREAASSYRFSLLLLSILAIYLAITGIVPNLIPALTDKGFTRASAASVQSAYGLALIVTRLAIGWLLDRFWAPAVAAVALAAPAIACITLMGNPGFAAASFSAALIGAAAGAELDLLAFFTARYFGLRHYGRIYGFLYSGVALGAGIGPMAFAFVAQRTGSYEASFGAASLLFCFGGFSLLALGRYPSAFSPKVVELSSATVADV